jgi:PAT family beta-lactamase induction signal transducer AmpG
MACLTPKESTQLLAFVVLLVAFFSASQDVALDAYRREVLFEEELGLGSAMGVNGYRIGMYIAGGIALIMADHIPWKGVYVAMAAIMLACTAVTALAPEPNLRVSPPRTIRDAVILPFGDFLRRGHAWEILIFILIYKLGDTMADSMFNPLYLNLGYTKTQIGAIAKTFGLWCSIGGGTIGGLVLVRLGILRSLWIFGITQLISTFGFCVLSLSVPSGVLLGVVISFETLCTGAATSAFVAFISSLCNPAFTATQYALLSSLMSVPRTLLGSSSGYLAKHLGWFHYYVLCTLLHLPGLLLLTRAGAWKRASLQQASPTTARATHG